MIHSDKIGLGAVQRRVLEMARSSGSYYLSVLLPGARDELWSESCGLHRAAIGLRGLGLIRFERGIVYPTNDIATVDFGGGG